MAEPLILLAPLLVLLAVLLFPFVGCLGLDPPFASSPPPSQQPSQQTPVGQASPVGQQPGGSPPPGPSAMSYEQLVLGTADLVSYWRLGDPGGGNTTAEDSAPVDKRPGMYKVPQVLSFGEKGALALGKAPNDKAVEFDGAQGFMEVDYHPLLNPPMDFSVEAWVRPDGAATGPQVVLSFHDVNATGLGARGYVLEVIPGPPLRLRARIFGRDSSNQPSESKVEASLGDGTQHDGWRHVVVTYDATDGVYADNSQVLFTWGTLRLYVNADDGYPDAELPTSTSPDKARFVANTSAPLRIGAGHVTWTPPSTWVPGQFFKGRIDEVALYRVALDGTTIKTHFFAAITP